MRFRKTNAIPDPGQQVRLLGRRGRLLRGKYRTISGPLTDPKDGVVIRVSEEREYREASREGRRAIGMPWPARQMEIVSSSEAAEGTTEPRPDIAAPRAGAQEPERRPWWVRWFGG